MCGLTLIRDVVHSYLCSLRHFFVAIRKCIMFRIILWIDKNSVLNFGKLFIERFYYVRFIQYINSFYRFTLSSQYFQDFPN